MFDRHSSDFYNPVFIRNMRGLCSDNFLLPGVIGLLVLAQLLAFWPMLSEDAAALTIREFSEYTMMYCSFVAVLMFAACLGIVTSTYNARNVDGWDASIGTRLHPWKILLGQTLSLLATQAILLVCALPAGLMLFSRSEGNYAIAVPFAILWINSILFVLLACVQCSTSTKKIPPLGMMFCVFLVIAESAIACATLCNAICSYTFETSHFEPPLFQQFFIAASSIVLCGATIYGANRPRTLDSTMPLHRTSICVWLLWLPILCIDNKNSLDNWRIITFCYSEALLFLAAIEEVRPSRKLAGFLSSGGRCRWLTLPLHGGSVPVFTLALIVSAIGQLTFALSLNDINYNVWANCTILQCYAIFYAALALWIRQRFHRSATVVCVIIFAVLAIFQCFIIIDEDLFLPLGIFTGGLWTVTCPSSDSLNPCVYAFGIVGLLLWYATTFKPFRRAVKSSTKKT